MTSPEISIFRDGGDTQDRCGGWQSGAGITASCISARAFRRKHEAECDCDGKDDSVSSVSSGVI
jgi:hypothetical protein